MYDDVLVRHFVGQLPDRFIGLMEQGELGPDDSIPVKMAYQAMQALCFSCLRALDEEVMSQREAKEMNDTFKDLVINDDEPSKTFSARPYVATQEEHNDD
jgi:hypothetical protein